MSALDTPVARRQVIKAFVLAGPTLAIAARIRPGASGAVPTKSAEVPDVAQGIGMHDEYKSIVAYLMEIDTRGTDPRMTRCTIAVDNGFCVNPMGTQSSLFGAAMDGFAMVFRAALHVDNGATRESNFHDYRWSRMFDAAPQMSCHILPNSNVLPGGIGELGLPAASAAAATAWARATGKAPRNFPINEYGA